MKITENYTMIDDKDADVLRDNAIICIEKGNLIQALEDLKKAHSIRPNGPYIRLLLVETLMKLERFKEVVPHLYFLNNPSDFILNTPLLNDLLNRLTPIVYANVKIKEHEYWSCDHLESTVVVLPEQIAFCCYPIPTGLKRPAMVENVVYNETFNFDASLYKNKKKQITEQNQTNVPHCKDCSYLKLADWSKNQKIKIVRLAPSYKCNFACTYCPQPHEQARTLFPLNIIEQLKNQDLLDENFLFTLSGGEPALLENFAEACSFAIENKYRVVVASNGTVFVPSLHDALKANLATVTISLDAGTYETYKLIKKTKLFQKVCLNVSKYSEDNENVILKYVLMDINATYTEIEKFVEIASNTKVGLVHVGFDAFSGNVPSDKIISAAAHMFSECKKWNVKCVYSDLSIDRDKKRVALILESENFI